ncbi:MAG: right-handed parallel beta-helix repeat-containing protein, partial [Myxococcales bacterium]
MADRFSCDGATEVSSADEWRAALAEGARGACVVANAGTYRGSFELPAGTRLLAREGAAVVFEGDAAAQPALLLNGGEGTALVGVTVRNAPGIGVFVRDGAATVERVTVERAGATGLMVNCAGPGCLEDRAQVEIRESQLRSNEVGLWAVGARVRVAGGVVAEQASTKLTGGWGVLASNGARLEMNGTEVTGNEEIGVLVDGVGGTSSTLTDVKVLDNKGRGIWAQKLDGTDQDPRLRIQGEATEIRGNHIVGIGARNSKGIIVVNGKVSGTRARDIQTDFNRTEAVGDGVGLFENTGFVTLDNLSLEENARTQMLVDRGDKGIIVVNGKVSAGAGRYKVVVQRTAAEVTIPA